MQWDAGRETEGGSEETLNLDKITYFLAHGQRQGAPAQPTQLLGQLLQLVAAAGAQRHVSPGGSQRQRHAAADAAARAGDEGTAAVERGSCHGRLLAQVASLYYRRCAAAEKRHHHLPMQLKCDLRIGMAYDALAGLVAGLERRQIGQGFDTLRVDDAIA